MKIKTAWWLIHMLALILWVRNTTVSGSPVEQIPALPVCEGGINRAPERIPSGPPGFDDTSLCVAEPTFAMPSPVAMITPPPKEGESTNHAGYHFLGASTVSGVQGLYGQLCVTDPGVRHGLAEFVATWYMVDTFTPQRWTQVG